MNPTVQIVKQEVLSAGMVDFDLCWAFDLADPWGNRYEVNCYDYEGVQSSLVEPDGISPVRYWPRELYDAFSASDDAPSP